MDQQYVWRKKNEAYTEKSLSKVNRGWSATFSTGYQPLEAKII